MIPTINKPTRVTSYTATAIDNIIRKNRKGGGIAIFIRNSLLYKIRDDLSINCDDIESLSIEIVNDHTKNFIINVVYRPPDGDLSISETFFRKILSENTNANKTLFLVGDFNINVLDYENTKNFKILYLA